MASKDYMETFKDGINLVGKMAARGMSVVSSRFKSDEKPEVVYHSTALFYQRHILSRFGDMIPRVTFHEPVMVNRLSGGFVKKLVRSSAEKAFVAAGYSLLFGQKEFARGKLREALVADPQYTDCYFLLGSLHLEDREFEKAEEYFSKCRLLPTGLGKKIYKFFPTYQLSLCVTENLSFVFTPDIQGLNLLLALSQRNAGKLIQAIQTLEQILSVMPESPEVVFFLAVLYYEAAWDEKIIEMLKEVAPINNLSVLTAEILVMAWIKKNNYNLAEGILQKAMEAEVIEPYLVADLRNMLGDLAKKCGRVAESSAYLSKTRKQYPDYQNIEKRLGIKRNKKPLSTTGYLPPKPEAPRYEVTTQPTEEQTPQEGAGRTVMVSPEMLPGGGGKASMEEGVRLKSKDGKVDMPLPDSLVIGREAGDLVLTWDTSASRIHARIFKEKGQVWVEDKGSTNGTWINQHRISSKRVFNKGDVLLIGKTEFYLE